MILVTQLPVSCYQYLIILVDEGESAGAFVYKKVHYVLTVYRRRAVILMQQDGWLVTSVAIGSTACVGAKEKCGDCLSLLLA